MTIPIGNRDDDIRRCFKGCDDGMTPGDEQLMLGGGGIERTNKAAV